METKKELQLELARLEALVTETKEKIENCLEVGEWYKVSDLKDGCLGFNGFGQIIDDVNVSNGLCAGYCETICIRQVDGKSWIINYDAKFEEATRKEVEQALIKEAKKRGFKVGVKYKPISNIVKLAQETYIGDRDFKMTKDYRLYMGFQYIFSGGKWATIITEPEYKDGDIVVATIGSSKYIITFKDKVDRYFNCHNYLPLGSECIMKSEGAFDHIDRYATEEEKDIFLSLLNPQPKVGDIVKVWDADEDVFLIGKLKSIDSKESHYPYVIAESTGSPYYFKHAKTLTQQEVIELLF